MKTKSRPALHRFELKLLGYGNSYYIERIAELEAALAKKPRQLQIDMIGDGEIPADTALLIRSILQLRSPKARLITNARSSLAGGSVLVWLCGDSRMIREHARLFFRKADVPEVLGPKGTMVWDEEELHYVEADSEIDPEEADYAQMLKVINEFLPVEELVGRPITAPMLRQFGLVENEKLDQFLATAFGKPHRAADDSENESNPKRAHAVAKERRSGQLRK
jgi:hypothetical protein